MKVFNSFFNRAVEFKILIILGLVAFILRADISFPAFTPDEARIAYRSTTLISDGKDELGRRYPLIFNGSEDYQLPLVSYITSAGTLLFGKTEVGARIPFILAGVAIVLLVYKSAILLTADKKLGSLTALLVAFSPPLIFLSRVPNETIILTLLITSLFYILLKGKAGIIFYLSLLAALITSKYAWFLLPPFIFATLVFFGESFKLKEKIKISGIVFSLSVAAIIIFLQVPQSTRSLTENNFTIFTDITIQNGVNRLRGQGVESGWPEILGKIFLNKFSFVPIGFLHWLSNISPNVYFGQIDLSGRFSFLGLGGWAKILIFPAFYGLYLLVRNGQRKIFPMLLYIPLLTFPSFFVYPNLSPSLIVLTLPFVAIVVALGLVKIKKGWMYVFLALMILEVFANLVYKTNDIKNANSIRPVWIKQVVVDVYSQSKKTQVLLSDDLVSDISPYIGWYTGYVPPEENPEIDFPYKYNETNLKNIILQGYDEEINLCGTKAERSFFLSKKTLKLMEEKTDIKNIKADYTDGLGNQVVYHLPYKVCLK